MSEEKKVDDGGPAFPSHGTMGEVNHQGMSLRQYLCGQALAGMLAQNTINASDMAMDVVTFADAVIKAEKESR